MKIMKKLVACALATATAICCIPTLASAVPPPRCDVNEDGDTNWADAVLLLQYLAGHYDITSPETADFDKDGFVTETDCDKLMSYLVVGTADIDFVNLDNYSTDFNNHDVRYYRYSASTGNLIDTYTVPGAPYVNETYSSPRNVIGSDTRYPDNSHSGICKIEVNNEIRTGFVVGENLILTSGSNLLNHAISSIKFYNSNGNIESTATAIEYSIPSSYTSSSQSVSSRYDYALIKTSTSLSDEKCFELGYALDYAIDQNKPVRVTGFNYSNIRVTGEGSLIPSTVHQYMFSYNCDTSIDTSIGAPVYTDVVYNGEHHYVAVGIHTKDTGYGYNSGVRICPNITNLISYNS